MNNNPVSLLFNLTETAVTTINHAVKSGVLLATAEKTNNRIKICLNCSNLDKTTVRCSICGCYMNTKVRFDAAKCPASKW